MKVAFVHGAGAVPAVPLELPHADRAAAAVRAGAGAAGADPQAAGPGHGAGVHPRAVRDAVRGGARMLAPAGDRRGSGLLLGAGDLVCRAEGGDGAGL